MIDTPARQVSLSFQQSSSNEMAANDELLIIYDRDHLLLFDLNDTFDENSIPEIIDWKFHLDGRILDLHYSFYFKLFFFLSEEKLFTFHRSSPLTCLSRFTSTPWSCTTLLDSIYILYRSSLCIEQYLLDQDLRSIRPIKQWQCNEILINSEHDQHFRCIRSNPNQDQLAVLVVSFV